MKKLFSLLVVLVFVLAAGVSAAESWTCPNCGREGNDGNFCPTCAEPRPSEKVVCPGCGAEYDRSLEYVFCPNCATPLTGNVQTPPAPPAAPGIGSIVTFGSYEQDGNPNNGAEPVEWIVLDVVDGKALLLSRYGLDTKMYHGEDMGVTWEGCSLRNWLNGEFLGTAFSAAEQDAVLSIMVDNSAAQGYAGWNTDGGADTVDRVFLLSCAEADLYFGGIELSSGEGYGQNTVPRAAPTDYLRAKDVSTLENILTAEGVPAGCWWLRSPGNIQSMAALIAYDGSLDYGYVDSDWGIMVRPAFWLNLEAGVI